VKSISNFLKICQQVPLRRLCVSNYLNTDVSNSKSSQSHESRAASAQFLKARS